METQKLVILGASGNVGTELIKQLAQRKRTQPERNMPGFNLVGMVNSSGWLWEPRGIDLQDNPELALDLQQQDQTAVREGKPRCAMKKWMEARKWYLAGLNLEALFEELCHLGLDDVVFIDLTASNSTSLHEEIVSCGGNMVTANKVPLVEANWKIFQFLTGLRRKYAYSCSVMAGAPAVSFLKDCFEIGDMVVSIEGCFSGTLGALCTRLHEGDIAFSELIKQLKANGDTEPDPRIDLSGQDVARKMVILARSAGYEIGLEDVKVEPFITGGFGELEKCSVEEFMERARIFDSDVAGRFMSARMEGKTLRYVASLQANGEKPEVTIGLRKEPLNSSLGSLKGNLNRVIIHTATHHDLPNEIIAPGSGIAVTAKNIRRDLLNVARTE